MWLNRDFHPPPTDQTIEVKSISGQHFICRYFDDAWRDVEYAHPIDFIYWNRQP